MSMQLLQEQDIDIKSRLKITMCNTHITAKKGKFRRKCVMYTCTVYNYAAIS